VKGSGLGLFIVRAIAKRHGGKVTAYSEGAGKGTTVTLELPRVFTT
jgi:signal transduction histidine kinase